MAKWTSDKIASQKDKVFIVTGANSGCGLASSKVLAEKGATVVMCYRNAQRSKKQFDEVTEIANANGGKVIELVLDLADLSSVKAAAQNFLDMNMPLHCLINNAGVMMCPFSTTKDGFEMQFGTNHLGHFAFTALLFPTLVKTAEESGKKTRLVNLSSSAHHRGPREGIMFDNLLWDKPNGIKYHPRVAYGQSKFANVLFSQEIADRMGDDGPVICNAVHPGVVNTNLTRHAVKQYSPILIKAVQLYRGLLSPHQGALTQLYCATDPEIEEKNWKGQYFVPIAKHSPLNKKAPKITKEMKTKLWEVSEQMTGVTFAI